MYGIYEDGNVVAKFAAPTTVRTNHPSTGSDTLSLKRYTTRRTAQRWEIVSNVEPLSYGAQDLFVSLVTKGTAVPVTVTMPQNFGAKHALTSNSVSVVSASPASAGASQVAITGNSGRIPKGTFIKFSNHGKVYMLTQNTDDNSPLYLYPTLRTAVPAGASVYFKDDVMMTCLYETDLVKGMVYSDGILMDLGSITLVEKL